MASALASALAGRPRGYAGGGLVTGNAGHYQVTPDFVSRIKGAETGGEANPNTAVSSAGAQGGMQVMPATAAEVAARIGLTNYDPTNPEMNTQVGTAYMNQLANTAGIDGDPAAIAAAYNAGPGRYLAGGTLPGETQRYVAKIMGTAMPSTAPGQPVAGVPSESDLLNQQEAARHGGGGGVAPVAGRQVYDRPIGPTIGGAPMPSGMFNAGFGSPSARAPAAIPGESESDILNRQEAAKHAGFGGFGSIMPMARQVYSAPIGPTITGAPMRSGMLGNAGGLGNAAGSGSSNERVGGGGAGTMSPGGGSGNNTGGADPGGASGGADPRGDHTVAAGNSSGASSGAATGSNTRPGLAEGGYVDKGQWTRHGHQDDAGSRVSDGAPIWERHGNYADGGFVGSKVRGHQPETRTIDFPDDAWKAIYGGRDDTPGAPQLPGTARRTNFLAGGPIPGKPDGAVDNHKINADEGEFVVRRSAASQAGPQLLQAINDPATAAKLRSLFNPQLIGALQKAGIIPQGGGGLASAIAGRR